jgi:hypothetical protein
MDGAGTQPSHIRGLAPGATGQQAAAILQGVNTGPGFADWSSHCRTKHSQNSKNLAICYTREIADNFFGHESADAHGHPSGKELCARGPLCGRPDHALA